MIPGVTILIGLDGARAKAGYEGVHCTPVILRAVLHKEFVGPKSDKLLGTAAAPRQRRARTLAPASSVLPALGEYH